MTTRDKREDGVTVGGGRAKYVTRGGPANDVRPAPAFALSETELEGLMERAVTRALGRAPVRLVDRQDLARQLGVSAAHVDALRKRGLPSVMLGQSVRFETDKVLDWLRSAQGQNDSE